MWTTFSWAQIKVFTLQIFSVFCGVPILQLRGFQKMSWNQNFAHFGLPAQTVCSQQNLFLRQGNILCISARHTGHGYKPYFSPFLQENPSWSTFSSVNKCFKAPQSPWAGKCGALISWVNPQTCTHLVQHWELIAASPGFTAEHGKVSHYLQ